MAALHDAKFPIVDRANGRSVYSKGKARYGLLRTRRTDVGATLAQAAGNSPFGATAAFRAIAPKARQQVDRALRKLAAGGSIDAFVSTVAGVAGGLERAAATKVDRPKSTRIPSGIVLNPDERSRSVRTVSGGLPTLGKHRK